MFRKSENATTWYMFAALVVAVATVAYSLLHAVSGATMLM